MTSVTTGEGFLADGVAAEFDESWWDRFGDPALTALIGDALAANKSLDVAAANVRIAEAVAARARLDQSYSTGSSAGAEIGRAAREGADVV
ncbi:MAG: hypothetical protein RLN72_08980, partial [Henriciella sp.]